MDIFKTLLMGCGALAILGMVGCVGLVGVGSYAVDQALEEELSLQANENRSTRPKNSNDPFSDYSRDGEYDDEGEPIGGWAEDTE